MTRRTTEMRFYAIFAICSLILKNQYFAMGLYSMAIFWNVITFTAFIYIAILWVSSLLNAKYKKNNKNLTKNN